MPLLGVVACHVDVEAAETLFIFCGIIERGAVGEHEGVLLLKIIVGEALQLRGSRPLLADEILLEEAHAAVGGAHRRDALVAQLGHKAFGGHKAALFGRLAERTVEAV